MIRDTAHRRFIFIAAAACKCQSKLFGYNPGILEKHFIKIAQTKKKNAPGILLLRSQILLHHRRKLHYGIPPVR